MQIESASFNRGLRNGELNSVVRRTSTYETRTVNRAKKQYLAYIE